MSSAIRSGMGLAREGRDVTEKMRDGIITSDRRGPDGAQGGAVAAQLPKRFTGYERRDDIVQMKQQLMDPSTGMTPFGRAYASDEDFKWLERKEAASEAVNYDSWFNKNFNVNDLAGRQFAQEINPDFYASRERELMERAEMVVRLKKLQLRGPQDEEDLRLQYLLNSGRVTLPADWDRIGADWTGDLDQAAATSKNQAQFQSGLLRMPLFRNEKQRVGAIGDNREAKAPFQDGATPYGFYSWGANNNQRMASYTANAPTLSATVLDRLKK